MPYMGISIACKSSGILKVLCKVQPPVNNVAAIPLDAVANAILPSDHSLARIILIKKSYLFHLEHPKINCLPHFYLPWNRSNHTPPADLWLTMPHVALHRLAVHFNHNLFLGDIPMQAYHYDAHKSQEDCLVHTK